MVVVSLHKFVRAALQFAVLLAIVGVGIGYSQPRPLPGRLKGNLHGEAAIAALGADLPQVAQAHKLRADELHMLLKTHRSLAVDVDGALLYVCEAPVLPQAALETTTYVSAENTSASGDPFRLHSFPGASKVIYLDFNGHTTIGTQWNTKTGGSAIVSQPFDLDGSPTTWSTSEQDVIRRVWQRVAEDFAPFVVDVTTEDPGVEALRRTSSSDAAYGMRVVISPTNWYNTGAGGVGYVGSFSASSDTPCFAFAGQLGNSEGPIAETASHEAGHTLGLYHDGSSSTEYYAGHGDWAPIMGNSFYRSITHFSRGEYAGANNAQDDMTVVSGYIPYATDDHGNTFGTASALAGPTVSDGGTIERSSDVDVFSFTTPGGTVSLNIQGPAPSPNLDIKAELLSASGQSLQVSNPTALSASISTTLPSGTFYLRISGVGSGDPSTTGYSNYGSVGNYVITGTIGTSGSTPPPPGGTGQALVTAVVPGTVRNNYTGWVGMQITVGSSSLTVSQLGRLMLPGNTGTHRIKLARSSDGQDVPGAVVTVSMTGGTSGEFRYGALSSPVTLDAGATYYLVSEESAGGDSWYNWDARVTTTTAATNGAAVFGTGPANWYPHGGASQSYVPVSLTYTTSGGSSGGGGSSPDTPGGDTAFVSSFTPGTLRNNYSGWVGMQITVGPAPMTVSQLGRMMVAGNSGTHRVKLVKASDGTDVAGATASISMSGGTAGEFRYAALSSPVTLNAGTTYYLLSEEAAGGDSWYNWDARVVTTAAAAANAAVFGTGPGNWYPHGGSNQSYVPVSLKYANSGGSSTGGSGGDTAFVTSITAGTLRNNYTGWVGMQITVGSAPVTVSQLGRMMFAGNSGTHRVKLVKASDGTDVAGGTATISMSGGVAGEFRYVSLGSPVTLNAGTTYYLLSEEAADGDSWYNWDSRVTTTSAATATAAVFGTGQGNWYPHGGSGQCYVPVSFKYNADSGSSTGGSGGDTTFITSFTPGTSRNDYSGWVGMQITVGSVPVTVSQLGRLTLAGNSGMHTIKLVNASDGMDVPGGTVTLSTVGAPAGEFKYASLSSPVTLNAGATYYLVSQETAGGDSWYNWDARVVTTSTAVASAAVFGTGPGNWYPHGGTNQCYVPVNFKY